MAIDLKTWSKKEQAIIDWLKSELSGLHTGRATPAVLDSIKVDSFGSKLPLKAVATVGVLDAKTLQIVPWDSSQTKAIEQAIAAANLGLSTSPSGNELKVIFPDLTGERRQAMAKVIIERLETAKVRLKKDREKVWQDIQDQTKAGQISEDDKFRLKDELQQAVNKIQADLEAVALNKQSEISA